MSAANLSGAARRAVSPRLALFVLIGSAAVAACSSNNDTTTTPTASAIGVLSGNSQTANAGAAGLAAPFKVKVTDQNGNAISNITVNFTASGGATLMSPTALTGTDGSATDSLTLVGNTAGIDSVTASVSGVSTSAIFTYTVQAVAVPTAIAVTSGNTQVAVAGAAGLSAPMVVTVTDQNGNPVSNATVTFTASSGATLTVPTAVTGVSGTATDSITLVGTTAGTDTVTASVAGVATNAVFTYTVNAGAASAISVTSGNNQTGGVGTALTAPMVVKVVDAHGNPVSGATVNWTTTGGVLGGLAATMTDNTGTAQNTLTLPGTAGAVTVTAALQGTAATATFTETGS